MNTDPSESRPGESKPGESKPGESKLVAQRLLPQTSLRFLVGLITVCAGGMFTFRAAIVGNQLWAQCAAVVIATGVGCFIAYALLFLLADLFSTAASPLTELARGHEAVGRAAEVSSGHGQDIAADRSQGNPSES